MQTSKQVLYEIPLSEPVSETPAFFWVDDKKELIIFRDGKRIRAFSSICPHMGAQLTYDSKRQKLTCPWHGLSLCLRRKVTNHHRYAALREYRVELVSTTLFIYADHPNNY